MLNNSNNGMFLETLINNSSNYYKSNKIALIFKRNIPVKIIKNNTTNIIGKISDKAQTDYYGLYNGIYFDFEAKQTIKDVFLLSNLKEHQFQHLKNVKEFKGISFLLLHFTKYDEFYAIDSDLLQNIKTKITREWCLKNAFALKLFFPGIIDIVEYLKSIKL